MTLESVRALLLKRAKCYARRKSSAGLSGWAEAHSIPKSRVSEFLAGKRLPNPAILEALGLEWKITRRTRSLSTRGDRK